MSHKDTQMTKPQQTEPSMSTKKYRKKTCYLRTHKRESDFSTVTTRGCDQLSVFGLLTLQPVKQAFLFPFVCVSVSYHVKTIVTDATRPCLLQALK